MQYTNLGRTGCRVSRLCLGTMNFGPRTPEHLRLSLDDGQLTRVFLLSVIALPFCILLLGAGVWWVRRS